MPLNTTVQFRTDADTKEAAFAVFREMGISPSTAMQLFLQQVQRTKTLPFIVTANHENRVSEAGAAYQVKEEGYDEWLRARLERTVNMLDSGQMQSYPHDEAMQRLDSRIAARRKLANAANAE